MRGARIREKLARGGTVLNVMLPFHAPGVVELLGVAKVDCVMIDLEHGAMSESECEHMVRAADAVDLPAIVRVPNNLPSTILRILDLGASGIIAPHVASAAEARAVVEAAKYGPRGNRSFGGPRAMVVSGLAAPEYCELANRETIVIGLFEDGAGADQVDDIFAVDGLDALAVGPNDLAFSMGYPAQPWHPEVQRVVDRVIDASRRAGKATGLPASSVAQAKEHAARGCRIVSLGVGALIGPTARAYLEALTS
jgi:4-hydroxy-2-oxoheptanedioate aldolase